MKFAGRTAAVIAVLLVLAATVAWFSSRSTELAEPTTPRVEDPSAGEVGAARAALDLTPNRDTSDRHTELIQDIESEVAISTENAADEATFVQCRIELTGLVDEGDDIEVVLTAGRERAVCARQSSSVWFGRIAITEADVAPEAVLAITSSSARYAWNWRGEPITAELLERGSFDCTMELHLGGSLTIRAAAANGRAAAACKIWMNLLPRGESSTALAFETRSLVLDERGTGTLTGMEPGRWAMSVDENHWWELAHLGADVKPAWNEEVEWVLAELDPGEYLSGRVIATDPDGRCVHLELLSDSGVFMQDHAVEHGLFFLGGGERYEVRARVVNRCTCAVSESVTLHGGRHDHVLVLDP